MYICHLMLTGNPLAPGRFNKYTVCSLYKIQITVNSSMGVMPMGNVARARFDPICLAIMEIAC